MKAKKPWVVSSCAVSKAVESLHRATKCAALEKWSTIVRIVLLPAERSRPVTKSRAMCDQSRGGVDRGCNNPASGWFDGLFWAWTRLNRQSYISGHPGIDQKKWRCKKVVVRCTPGWQVRWAVWAQWGTWDRMETGLKSRPDGPFPGFELVCWASRFYFPGDGSD